MSVYVRASRRAKAYTRTTPTTRSLRKQMKKGFGETRKDRLFSKISRGIDAAQEKVNAGYLKSGNMRLHTLRNRRHRLITMHIRTFGNSRY